MPIQVIDRAVRILRIVARTGPSSLTRISSECRLPVPTVARILQSLVDNGILRRLDDKTYHLGARLVPLSTRLEPFRQPLEIVCRRQVPYAAATGSSIGPFNSLGKLVVPNCETYEQLYPVRFVQHELRCDAAGAGEFRGGSGASYHVIVDADAEYDGNQDRVARRRRLGRPKTAPSRGCPVLCQEWNYSEDTARRSYGVAISPDRRSVDIGATRRLRGG